MLENNFKKLPSLERSTVGAYISANVGEGYFDILKRKSKSRSEMEKVFSMVA